jgi:cytochrome P450
MTTETHSAPSTLDLEVERLFAGESDALANANHTWRRLREESPVYDYGPITLLSRYADVHAAFRSEHMSKNQYVEGTWTEQLQAGLPEDSRKRLIELRSFEAMYVTRSSGEDHVRRRRVAHRAFTPRRIAELGDEIERYTNMLVGELLEQETPDFMRFAYELPLMAITSMLGMPNVDRDLVRGWAGKLLVNVGAADPETLKQCYDTIMELREYVREAIAANRRAEEHTHLVSTLMAAEEDNVVSEDELAAIYANFIAAGFETTMNLIGVGFLELMRHRDQWRLLCEDPEGRAPNAVEELLRYVAPAQWSLGLPVVDLEFSGHTVPARRTVFTIIAAANRDPEVFTDPERMDILRPNARDHLGLGFGPHFCLGSSLARIEGQIAFRTLARRFPDAELAEESIEWTAGSALRRPRHLAVNLGRDAGPAGDPVPARI